MKIVVPLDVRDPRGNLTTQARSFFDHAGTLVPTNLDPNSPAMCEERIARARRSVQGHDMSQVQFQELLARGGRLPEGAVPPRDQLPPHPLGAYDIDWLALPQKK